MRAGFLIGLAALLVMFCLGWAAGCQWKSGQYSELVGRVEQQNQEAGRKLAKLTRLRDEKQAELNRLALEQEKKDAEAEAEINRLASELAARPVRVRIVTEAGACAGGAGGGGAGTAEDRSGDPTETYGLLPESNSRRLGVALKEIETLSAAYRSCRARLIPDT